MVGEPLRPIFSVPKPISSIPKTVICDLRALIAPMSEGLRGGIPVGVNEMAQGIGKLRRAGGTERADRLDRWLDGLLASYTDRILPLDAQAARLAGQISDAAIAQGYHPGFADVAIAALAQNAGLLLLTCNLKHFLPLGVACADPLIALPGTHPNSAPAADSE